MLPCETGGSYLDKALSHHGVLHALLYMSINPTEMRLHLLFTISVIVLDIVSLCDCPPHGGTSVYSVFWTKIFFTVVALSSYA